MKLKTIIKEILPYGIVKCLIKYKVETTSATKIEPALYNEFGNRKRTFYLDDCVCKHSPYTFSSIDIGKTQYINWDRFNRALPVHFYSHERILNPDNYGKRNFGIIVESETIIPDLYSKLLNSPDIVSKYDAIFTHSERLLKKYKNAYFIPGSSVWYGGTTGGGILEDDKYLRKSKDISLVSSNKAQCNLHKFRMHLADILKEVKNVDVMGTYDGGLYVSISESLENYMFSIVIENNVTSCYFTEKLLNCFAAMVIPIYVGATNIGEYFDKEGIISISPSMSDDEIMKTINKCTKKYYESNIEHIRKNYELAKKYLCIEDYIYENYKDLFI